MSSPPSPTPTLRRPGRSAAALRLAAGYAAFGLAWVLLSDHLLSGAAGDAGMLTSVSQWKGAAFVLGTSLLFYAVTLRTPALQASRHPRRHMAIRTPVLLWTFAGAAAAILLAGLVALSYTARGVHDQTVDQLRGLAELKADILARWQHERQAEGRLLATQPELLQLLRDWQRHPDDASRDRLVHHLRTLLFGSVYVDAQLLDAGGEPLLGTGGYGAPLPGTLRRRALEALAAGRVLDTGLYLEGTVRYDVLVPLPADVAKARAAVLVLRADPVTSLLPMAHRLRASDRSTRVLLFRPLDAGQALFLDAAGREGPVAQTRPNPFATALPGQAARIDGTDGRRDLAYAVPVASTGWSIAVAVPRASLDQRMGPAVAAVALVDLLALAAAFTAVHLVLQRRQLDSTLRQQAEQDEKLQALQLLEAITNGSTDAIYAKDAQGRYIFVNGEVCRALGRSAGQLLGHDASGFFPPAEAQRMQAAAREVLSTGNVLRTESTVTTLHGQRVYLDTLGPLHDSQGRITGTFGVGRDITERKHEEDRHRQWATAFESTRDGVMIVDTGLHIQAVNRAFTDITGYAREEVVGHKPIVLKSGRHDDAFYRGMWRSLREQGHWQGEIWNRRRNGEIYPEWLTISAVHDDAQHVTHYVGVFTDITRIKRDEAELERLAHYDLLTDLPNRRLLQARLGQAIAHAQRHATQVAVLYIDLDGFKTVNDSLGHPVGDELLIQVAERLKQRLRKEDTLGRLGGDEFLVVMDSLRDPSEAAVLARDLLLTIAEPVPLSGGRDAYVTASIGISMHPDDGCTNAVEMLRNADAAMYRAKDQGRNRFCFYTADLHVEASERLQLEAALSRAIERDELVLHFQPRIEALGERLASVEALLRWNRVGHGLVPPGGFIPAAERSGLILSLGNWVIDQACRQMRVWREQGADIPCVAVNVAARQFAVGNLDVVVRQALRKHDIPPGCLELELTESMLMENPATTAALLRRLKAIGVKLSLDDFGTGYSSLGYLQRFPIDTLKIDKSFVNDIGHGPDGSAIVDAVIALAHRLHLRVVAEGVETAEQCAYLRQQGCDELQGYYFSPPVPPEQLRLPLPQA